MSTKLMLLRSLPLTQMLLHTFARVYLRYPITLCTNIITYAAHPDIHLETTFRSIDTLRWDLAQGWP